MPTPPSASTTAPDLARPSRLRTGALALGAGGALLAGLAGLGATAAQAAVPAPATTVGTVLPVAPAASKPAGSPGVVTSSRTGKVYTVSNVAQLTNAVALLVAGDTVRLRAGTYDLHRFRPRLGTFGHHAVGTKARPIVFTAADPAHRPVLTGAIKLDGASYWRLSYLTIRGTIKGTDTLTFNGGTGWSLQHSEVTGAHATGALANVVVASTTSRPTNFTIAYDAIHEGATNSAKGGMLHEIYLTAVGSAGHSVISHNAIYDTPQGAAVKIGDGGKPNAPGISGVHVTDNTMYKNYEQVLMHGNVSDNTITRNLMVLSTHRQHNGQHVGVYLTTVTGHHNLIKDNWFARLSTPVYSNSGPGTYVNGGRNTVRSDPRFTSLGASGFTPRVAAAKAYGRYGH